MPPKNAENLPKGGIKSIDTMFSILDTIQEWDGAGVTELSNELDISKSTVHSHLTSLKRNRCVVKEGDTYHLGLRFLNFGGYASDRLDIYDSAKAEVDGLVNETGETAQMVVEQHGKGIYIHQARGDRAVKTDSYTGNDVYLHCTSVGKAILSQMSEERVDEIIDRHGLPQKTAETVTDRDELFDQLEVIRSRGHSFDEGERIEGIRCVGVPVTGDDGEVLGGLSLSGPTKRMDGEYFRETVPELLKRAARVIEINDMYS